MAIGIQNFPNIDPADSDYLYGRIKDNPGDGSGTPVNQLTNGDIQEFFAKLMGLVGIIPNGLPDNEYSGHQYIQAILKYININNSAGIIETNISGILKTKVIDIGDWNMDTTATIQVAHGLSDNKKIVCANAIIIADTGVGGKNVFTLDNVQSSTYTSPNGSIESFDSTYIYLQRLTGGIFDGALFDLTPYNRGYIYITYLD